MGLNHYKRYFKKGFFGSGDYLDKETIINDLQDHDIILNKRKQGITNWDSFKNFVPEPDLMKSCKVIKEKFLEYYYDYIKLLKERYLYPHCMFVASKKLVYEYCLWLFQYLKN